MRTLITLITFILAGFLLVYWDSKSSENNIHKEDFLNLMKNSKRYSTQPTDETDDYTGYYDIYIDNEGNIIHLRGPHDEIGFTSIIDKVTVYKDDLKEAIYSFRDNNENKFRVRICTNVIYRVSWNGGYETIIAIITNMNIKTTDNKKQEKSAGKKPNWEKIYSIDITKSDSYMTRKEYKEYIKQLKTMGVYKKSEDKGYKAYLEELKQSMINSALKRDWLSNFKNKTHSGTSRGTIYKVGNGGDWIYLQKTWEPNDNYDLYEVFDPQSKAIYSFRDNNDFLNIKGYVGMTIQNDIIYKSKEVFSSKEEVYTYFNSIKDYENNSDCERIIKLVPMTEDIMIDRLSEGFFY